MSGCFILLLVDGRENGRVTDSFHVCRFKSLRFLLTDSKVPRDTKRLVAGVALKRIEVGSFTEAQL